MKINELLMAIHRKDFNIEKELQVKKYLPIEEKKMIAQGIIYECTDQTDGAVKVDSVQQYLSYVKYMILKHTNLEYTSEDYDKLCSTEYQDTSLLNAIVGSFQGDANECNRILSLMMNDYLENNSFSNQIGSTVNELLASIVGLFVSLENKVSTTNIADMIPKDLDMNKLSSFLNNNYRG